MSSLPHVSITGAAAAVLARATAARPALQGQSCGYFDEPRLPGAKTQAAPDGSTARFSASSLRAEEATAVVFDTHAFRATSATEDDPCVLGRLTVTHPSVVQPSVPAVAQLNLTLFLGSPCPAVLLLTRIVIPVGWSPAAPGIAPSFEMPRLQGPVSLLLAGQLVHVPTERVSRGDEVAFGGLLRFTFGPTRSSRRLHAAIAVRTRTLTVRPQGLSAA